MEEYHINSSWWLSGVSSYMTIFSASTFVVWGGVAYKSGITAVMVAIMLGFSSLIVSRWIAGRWRRLKIKSPGEYLTVRFGHGTLRFYTVAGILNNYISSHFFYFIYKNIHIALPALNCQSINRKSDGYSII